MYPHNFLPHLIGIEDPIPPNKHGLSLDELNVPQYRLHCLSTRTQATVPPEDVMMYVFITSLRAMQEDMILNAATNIGAPSCTSLSWSFPDRKLHDM